MKNNLKKIFDKEQKKERTGYILGFIAIDNKLLWDSF